jgi:NFACT N-terminal and middle domains/NFACT protein RNA binding domain
MHIFMDFLCIFVSLTRGQRPPVVLVVCCNAMVNVQPKSWKRRHRRKYSWIRLAVALVASWMEFVSVSVLPWKVTLAWAFSIENWKTRRPLGTGFNCFRNIGCFKVVATKDPRGVAALYLSSSTDSEGEAWESESVDENVSGDSLEWLMEDDEIFEDFEDIETVNPTENYSMESDRDDALRREWERWLLAMENALSALEKKRNSLHQEMVKAERLESLQRRAQLLQTYRHMFTDTNSATVQDWEAGQDVVLTLDSTTYGSIGEEIDALYAQSKKLKRGKLVVGTLLDETTAAFNTLLKLKCDLAAVWLLSSEDGETPLQMDGELFRLVQDRLVASARRTNFAPPKNIDTSATATTAKRQGAVSKNSRHKAPTLGSPASNIRQLTSPAGCTILVGRNRRGNEHLSLTVARGPDIWMHARQTPGAHVVLQQRRGGPVATDACWQMAANLAAFYSDARSERHVWVSAAEPKHLQKPRGAPLGAIKVREEWRVLSGHPDDVPEECKAARAVSGQLEEYRIQDKAKLRKQNRQRQLLTKEKSKRKAQEKQKQREEQGGNIF